MLMSIGYRFCVVRVAIALCILAAGTAPTSAAEFTAGTFVLYDSGSVGGDCDVRTTLVLVSAKAIGRVASLANSVPESCAQFVEPQPRTYAISKVADAGSGTVIYVGSYIGADGRHEITIFDYRKDLMAHSLANAVRLVEEWPGGKRILKDKRR